MKQLSKEAVNEIMDSLKAEMLECEPMVPITIVAAIEVGVQLQGAEYMYNWLSSILDAVGLKAAQERNKRTSSIMKTFVPKG